jgi:hypothetical protein
MVRQRQTSQKIALEPWEVGGELLDILSRGLYSDAKDAVREYVQNGIDANAATVMVTVSGPRVVIRDDGAGMDWDTLRRARRFGVSEKSPKFYVGYRGIGLYASFGMCETLLISTRQAGMDELLHLRFHFGPMRRIVEQDRAAEQRVGVALANLLYEYTEFSREAYTGDCNEDHFTVVRLEGIGQEYRAQLADANALTGYLLNTLPVAFPQRDYGSVVNQWLKEHVGLNPVRLVLRVGNEPEFEVQPEVTEDVEAPQFHWIEDAQKEQIAFVWHALSTKGERLASPDGADEGSGTSGFLLKLKGFTLGDRLRLKPLWPPTGGRTLYHHYTGEVHILDRASVYPNAARNDLEPSPAKQVLLRHVGDYFTELNRRADLTRDILKTHRRMQGLQDTLGGLQSRHAEADQDPFELYRESKNLLDTLERTERELLRLRRGRRAVTPTPAQEEQLKSLTAELREAKRTVSMVVQATGKRTEGRGTSTAAQPRRETPPQAALLAKAVSALQAMHDASPSTQLQRATEAVSSAAQVHVVGRAVAVLDDLKATGLELSDAVEASRKELRTFLGWSPVGPVSLEQAFAETGFAPATERERALIRAIDRGLLQGLGGRGERYEAALRAIAESISEEDQLQ